MAQRVCSMIGWCPTGKPMAHWGAHGVNPHGAPMAHGALTRPLAGALSTRPRLCIFRLIAAAPLSAPAPCGWLTIAVRHRNGPYRRPLEQLDVEIAARPAARSFKTRMTCGDVPHIPIVPSFPCASQTPMERRQSTKTATIEAVPRDMHSGAPGDAGRGAHGECAALALRPRSLCSHRGAEAPSRLDQP
jgi:hypothetical protein